MRVIETTFDEALQRLHRFGPEFEGWLSNHGPMVVEAMARHGHAGEIHRWLDRYLDRLGEVPRADKSIDDMSWREALGEPRRLGDWLEYFARALSERPWTDVLCAWWPRLLPGIVAGATHGVIRTGHAVHALRQAQTPQRSTELGHALGYWAARFQPITGPRPPSGSLPAAEALRSLARVPDQSGGITARLRQLAGLSGWAEGVAALSPVQAPEQVPDALVEIIAAVSVVYLDYERSGNIMLIHAATAPTAVLRVLPALPRDLWQPSLAAAWTASAAVCSAYAGRRPPEPMPPYPAAAPAEVFARAVAHRDEQIGRAHV